VNEGEAGKMGAERSERGRRKKKGKECGVVSNGSEGGRE